MALAAAVAVAADTNAALGAAREQAEDTMGRVVLLAVVVVAPAYCPGLLLGVIRCLPPPATPSRHRPPKNIHPRLPCRWFLLVVVPVPVLAVVLVAADRRRVVPLSEARDVPAPSVAVDMLGVVAPIHIHRLVAVAAEHPRMQLLLLFAASS